MFRSRAARPWLVALAGATAALWLAGADAVRWRTLETPAVDPSSLPTLDGAAGEARGFARVALEPRTPVAGERRFVRVRARLERAAPGDGASSTAFVPSAAAAERPPALAVLRLLDDDGALLDWRSFALARPGAPASAGELVLGVPPAARALRLGLVVRAGAAPWRVAAVDVAVVAVGPAYFGVLGLVCAAFVALGATLGVFAVRRAGAAAALPGALVLCALVVGVALSEAAPWWGVAGLARRVGAHLPGEAPVDVRALFGYGHLVAFAALGFAAAALRRRLGTDLAETVAFLALVALASEALQRHLVDRTASAADLRLDAAGACLGLLAGGAAGAVARRRRARDARRVSSRERVR